MTPGKSSETEARSAEVRSNSYDFGGISQKLRTKRDQTANSFELVGAAGDDSRLLDVTVEELRRRSNEVDAMPIVEAVLQRESIHGVD